MGARFDSFVVFAEMRTGSNFLEANLNAFSSLRCHGEAFNPHFIGYPNNDPILGVDQTTRDADPARLLQAIKADTSALGGFRYFHDHDPRVFDAVMDDPRCAKIILTRNPVDSYVSWKIAQATGQWKLTDMKAHKAAQAVFDAAEFERHLAALQAFQVTLMSRLQTSGQTAFYVAYEDLQSVEVMNGLARYLGVDEVLESLDKKLKKQNPAPVSSKVANFDAMQEALARLDRFNLTRTPNFEPRRGPLVPSYVAGARTPLLYMPIKGGPVQEVRHWLRQHVGHRSFTVLRHPIARAHDAFCKHILSVDKGSYVQLRNTLTRRYKLPLPAEGPDASYDLAAHRTAFAAFLTFLKGNLSGQTAIRVDAAWCSQSQAISGFGEMCLPDRLIREEDLQTELAQLAQAVGAEGVPDLPQAGQSQPYTLDQIYDEEIEKLGAAAYQRDYMMFGFDRWG